MGPEQPAEGSPRVLANTRELAADDDGASGAVWKLTMGERHLDANLISLPAGGMIEEHLGPELDVLLHVVAGGGVLSTEEGEIGLAPGDLVWLPRRSRRQFTAGAAGLRYLSVHPRKPGLGLSAPPSRA